MNSLSGIVNRPAAIQFGRERRPAPKRTEEVRTTEDNDTPLATPDRQERDTIALAAPIGDVVVDTDGQSLNIAGGPLMVMLPPAQVTNPFQTPNRFQPTNE
jgi:hypothetical protein